MQHANCDREIKIYEGAKHHLQKEMDEVKKAVMKEIETWIFNRVKGYSMILLTNKMNPDNTIAVITETIPIGMQFDKVYLSTFNM
ncbi:hypothetical protein [Vaccinia virus]|uniref:Uncharacterized protein n=1 Tax=Vaccinia virus TaxID=10245 RepID=A0A2I6J103_VACCV|nr:hypothetical protein [Vaccinia virus]